MILIPLRALAWIYFWLPAPFKRAFGGAFGVAFRLLGVRAKVIRENLDIAFPGPERARERARLFREAYRHLGSLTLEIIMLLGPMKKFIHRNVEVLGLENAEKALSGGNGCILLSSHVGNWETMAAGGAILGRLQVLLVTKRLKPSWFHEQIQRGREKCLVYATYEPQTMKDVLSWLKQGKCVGFVLDQYAGPPVGVRVPVFGVPVGTMTAVAAISKRTGAPVVPVVNYRKPDGRIVVDIRPALKWQSSDDPNIEIALNTAYYAAQLEKDIYAHPEQWLWTHRRFKGDLGPLSEDEWRGRSRR